MHAWLVHLRSPFCYTQEQRLALREGINWRSIIFDNPEEFNALRYDMVVALTEFLAQTEPNPGIHAVLFENLSANGVGEF